MSLAPGTSPGAYSVTALLGEGGMGAVYRARDTKLNRDVALKVLLPDVANDPERLARFRREAQTLAALNHPQIAHIHGLEESVGTLALVMELVEGEDLSQRIARGPLPLDEALPIAKQIAEALEGAHEQGIIHRDLKPANIKVREDGTVKVLDFGLAKALESPSGLQPPASSLSLSPTITSPVGMTGVGIILGTAAYMAPEQARGKAVDKRGDIWAFGCVLFEMLAGVKAFDADDVTATLARVLEREPDLTTLPAAIPAHVRALIARCLVKDPRQRLRDIGEVRLALDGSRETAMAPPSAAPLRGRAWTAALSAAGLVIVALAVPTLRHLRESAPPVPPEVRLDLVTPQTEDPNSFALSPDGTQIVYVASGDGASRLWQRSLSATTAQPLAGTEGARSPFWAPDGQSIGFFTFGALKRIDIGSSAARVLAPILTSGGGTWSRDGVIIFAPALGAPLMRVSAAGGEATPVTTLAPNQTGHLAPWFLPDGQRFLYRALGTPDAAGVYLAEINGGRPPTRVTASSGNGLSGAVFLPAASSSTHGWLLWTPAGALLAQRLDVEQARLSGEPMTLGDDSGAVSVTPTGLVAYRAQADRRRQLTWMDRTGAQVGTLGEADLSSAAPRISPDGRRVAVSRTMQGNTDVWILDGARSTRLTFDPAIDSMPIWSPDGKRIAFSSTRTGTWSAFQKLTSGAGTDERLIQDDILSLATSWSPDGRFLLFFQGDRPARGLAANATSSDLWVVPMASERAATPVRLLTTPISEVFGAFSPDGRWVAFQVDQFGQDGRSEVFVRPFVPPAAGGAPAVASAGQWQVSIGGGIRPIWSHDGKELYFLDPAARMMAAPISVNGSVLESGAPVALFATRIVDGGEERQQATHYDVAPDGRFLINRDLGDAAAPITLLLNWRP